MAKMASKKKTVVEKVVEAVSGKKEVKAEVKESSWLKIKDETEALKKDLEKGRANIAHRELGMAYDGLMKALKEVDVWLQTIADVESAIEKKAKKA